MMDIECQDHTALGKLKRPNITQICKWIKYSWDQMKPEVVVKSFKKCRINNVLDCSEVTFCTEQVEMRATVLKRKTFMASEIMKVKMSFLELMMNYEELTSVILKIKLTVTN